MEDDIRVVNGEKNGAYSMKDVPREKEWLGLDMDTEMVDMDSASGSVVNEAPLLTRKCWNPDRCICSSKRFQCGVTISPEYLDVWRKEKDKDGHERKISRKDRIELGRLFQSAVRCGDWEFADTLVLVADTQLLNDALCISLDSIWFSTTREQLDGVSGLIKAAISFGARDYTRATLRTAFLASCVCACQCGAFSVKDTVRIMAERMRERLRDSPGDEAQKAEASVKVQKFSDWALRCIGFYQPFLENRLMPSTAVETQLQLNVFKTYLDLVGDHLTGKDFTEAFDATCFPFTLFSSFFPSGWASGVSSSVIHGLLIMLVEGGAENINQCFLEASRFGCTDLVSILLKLARQNNLEVDVELALGFASHHCKIATMEYLVDEGNAVFFLRPLMRAAERGCLQVVEWFVNRGCRDIDLCLALTAATASCRMEITAYLLPHVPKSVLSTLSIEILKAAGERSRGSLNGVSFLLSSDFLGESAETYAVADKIVHSDDDTVPTNLKLFLREHWSQEAFVEGLATAREHHMNFMRVLHHGSSAIRLKDLPAPLRTAIAYLPLYKECQSASGKLLPKRLKGQLAEATRLLVNKDVNQNANGQELIAILEHLLPSFLTTDRIAL